MEQQANYIRRIEIHGLWERFNIGWDLRPDVNILSGINGVGKTTILNRSVGYLEELSGEMKSDEKVRAKAATLSIAKRRFQDMIDELFSYTRKKIDRKRNDIAFYQDGELLFPYKLSSGEKQMLVILLTVLVQDNSHCVLFMDEPEASLHIEWQQKLIAMIRELNPNVQIILTTHSPAVIMEGWLDAVTEVSDISTLYNNGNFTTR